MSNLELWRNSFGPFREFSALSKMMDQMWDSYPAQRAASSLDNYSWNPVCEAKEDNANYYLKFDLPGVPKDSIKIDLHDDRITVTGERKEEKKTEEKDSKTHISEIFYGSFSRSMTFPISVDAEKSEAKYDHGVLTISLPKRGSNGARQLYIT